MFALLFCALALNSARGQSSPTNNATSDPTEIPLDQLMTMELVYAASKFEQKQNEAPSAVTVINAEEIRKYGHQNLADILRSVRGLYVSNNRDYEFLGTRGFNRGDFNSRVLVLVNGHRINNSLSDGAFIGSVFPIDVDLIERVEIIRGPGSVLYGNNAFFGVINVVTRRGADLTGTGAEVSGSVGSNEMFRRRITLGHHFTNGLEVLLSTTISDSQGADKLFYEEFNSPASNRGVAEKLDDEQAYNFFGEVRYLEFTLEGAFVSREKSDPTAPFGVIFNDPRTRNEDDRGYLNLKFAHEFPELFDLTAQIYYDRHDFRIGYPQVSGFFKEQQIGEWWGTEVQLQKKLFDRHTIIFGTEYRDDFRQEREVVNAATDRTTIQQKRSTENYGFYVQGDFAVVTNLHLNAGVRYDQYGDLSPAVNPRAALIYEFIPGSTLKLIGGTAFRAPNFFELGDPRFQDIDPERITTYELAYEQRLGDHLWSTLSGFYSEIEDLIGIRQGRFANLTGAESMGMEVELSGQWRNGLQGRISYTLQQTTESETGARLTDSPTHLGKANVTVPLWRDRLFAGLEFQYSSKRRTSQLGPGGLVLPGEDVAGFGIVNFTLFSRNLVPGLEASVSIYNLLDQKYGDPSTPFHQQDIIPQDGRMFRVKLTYRF